MGSACSVWTTLHLPQLTAPVLSRSTLLRLQVALQGNFPKRALGFVHFPGLSCSGSSSQVLHKAKTWLDMRFVPFPGPSSSGDQVLGERTVPGGLCISIISLVPASRPNPVPRPTGCRQHSGHCMLRGVVSPLSWLCCMVWNVIFTR